MHSANIRKKSSVENSTIVTKKLRKIEGDENRKNIIISIFFCYLKIFSRLSHKGTRQKFVKIKS
jgi:hypothetical protein